MNDWYIDRSKNFINDSLDEALRYFATAPTGGGSTEVIKSMTAKGLLGRAGGNPNAALTRFRDHGLLSIDNKIGESALDYVQGRLGKADLVIDLFIKRPCKKQDAVNIKPFVMLCIFFDNMMEMSIDPDDIFITYYECYEYLYPCCKYEDLSFELVEKVLAERQYEMGARYPKPRISLPDNEDTNLSIWFNALKETPVFMPQNNDRPILRPNLKQKEFFRFISVNADEFSPTPTNKNGDLYSYYCRRETGLNEILPNVVRTSAIANQAEVKVLFEYLFGYKKVADFDYSKFIKYECFGLFFPFITLPKLVIRHIYLCNPKLGEEFYNFIATNNGYVLDFEQGKFEYKGAFAMAEQHLDILDRNVLGMHITLKNDALSTTNPHVCIGWSNLGDLTEITDKESLATVYDAKYPDKSPRGRGQDLGQIWSFLDKLKVGDYVVYGDGRVAHIGQITSDYYYSTENPNQDPDYVNNKGVKWLKDVTYHDLPRDLHKAFYATRSIFSLNEYKSVILDILNNRAVDLEDQDSETDDSKTIAPRQPRIHKLHSLNNILYGAPGTGKTYSTAEYALAIIENRPIDRTQKTPEERAALMGRYNERVKDGQIVFTTFHQSYGYEDFIQGLRPDSSAEKMEFKTIDGVFKRIADKAIVDEDNDYVIIIDEINRANISKVFGELITLIEEDKRWGEVNAISVTLPSGEQFAVPNNLYIIGTMNSADKSISLIDTALRRRFEFIEVTPNYSTIADATLRSVLERLNKGLVDELDSTDLLIGHAYFIGKTVANLCDIMNHAIIPLLYEYFYDNAKKVKDQIKKAIEGLDFEIEDTKVGRIRLKNRE